MPTSNELFRDALLRRQIALSKFERGLQIDIMDLLDKSESELRVLLLDRLSALEGRDFTSTTMSRLNVLANAVAKLRAGAFEEATDLWDSSMQELAVAEASYLDQHLKQVMPVQIDTVLPDPVKLAAIVSSQPMNGRVLSEWASGVEDRDLVRIMDAVKVGMANGEVTQDIVRRVLGSRALDGTDGVLELSRREAASITQTAISTVANEARQAYYEANDDIFTEEQWVATLDDVTCEECGALDGETFPVGEGDQPPLHFNCRCVRVAVIGDKNLGTRPAVTATEEELQGLSKEERRERLADMVGQVPAKTTYSEWLSEQTDKFQDHVLGPNRAALFRDGELPLSRFVNSRGDTYTLDQLRTLEPEAFRRAGI